MMRRLIPLLACLAACGPESPAYVVDDSSGVPVIENYRSAWGDRPAWRIDPTPVLSVPQWSPREARDSFHLSDAMMLPDGTLAIANSFTAEIGIVDASGAILRRFGGKGLDPGQFQTLRSIHLIDDAVWGFDGMGRWNVFDVQGTLLSSMYLEPHGGPWNRVEPFGNEMAVLASSGWEPASETGRMRARSPVLRYERTGRAVDTLAIVPGREVYVAQRENGQSRTFTPFSPYPVIHGGGELLYYGSGDRMLIEVYGNDRVAERVVSVPNFDLQITDDEWEQEVAWYRELDRRASERDPTAMPMLASNVERRDTRPAYSGFVEDSERNLWVAAFDPAYSRRTLQPTNRWTVFDPDGRWLGTIETPPGLAVTEIGADYILGIKHSGGRSVVQKHTLSR